jgi:hypothetical protein
MVIDEGQTQTTHSASEASEDMKKLTAFFWRQEEKEGTCPDSRESQNAAFR